MSQSGIQPLPLRLGQSAAADASASRPHLQVKKPPSSQRATSALSHPCKEAAWSFHTMLRQYHRSSAGHVCVPSASSGASSSTAGAAAPEPLGLPPAQLDLVMGQFVQLQRIIMEGAADAKRRRKKPSVSSPEVVLGAAPALSPADALVTAAADAPADQNAEEESLPITAMLAGLQSALAPVAPAGVLPQGSSSSSSSGAGPSALACIPPMSYSGSALLPRAPTFEPGMTSGSAPTEQFLEWLALAPPAWVNFANGLSMAWT